MIDREVNDSLVQMRLGSGDSRWSSGMLDQLFRTSDPSARSERANEVLLVAYELLSATSLTQETANFITELAKCALVVLGSEQGQSTQRARRGCLASNMEVAVCRVANSGVPLSACSWFHYIACPGILRMQAR